MRLIARVTRWKARLSWRYASLVVHKNEWEIGVLACADNSRFKATTGQNHMCCLPACLPAYLSMCLPVYVPVCLSTCLPACLPAYLSICLPACLPACLSICLSACLPVIFACLMYVEKTESDTHTYTRKSQHNKALNTKNSPDQYLWSDSS